MKKLLLALVLMLLFAGTALAQDATREPAATQEPTAAATEAAPVEEEKPVMPANTAGTVFLILIPILSVAFGGGGLLAIIIAFRKDRAAVAASEQLGDSIPRPVAERMLTIIDALTAGLQAGKEAIDGRPAAEKPAEYADLTTDGLIMELQRRGYTVAQVQAG